jgi:hypothetical protein
MDFVKFIDVVAILRKLFTPDVQGFFRRFLFFPPTKKNQLHGYRTLNLTMVYHCIPSCPGHFIPGEDLEFDNGLSLYTFMPRSLCPRGRP